MDKKCILNINKSRHMMNVKFDYALSFERNMIFKLIKKYLLGFM